MSGLPNRFGFLAKFVSQELRESLTYKRRALGISLADMIKFVKSSEVMSLPKTDDALLEYCIDFCTCILETHKFPAPFEGPPYDLFVRLYEDVQYDEFGNPIVEPGVETYYRTGKNSFNIERINPETVYLVFERPHIKGEYIDEYPRGTENQFHKIMVIAEYNACQQKVLESLRLPESSVTWWTDYDMFLGHREVEDQLAGILVEHVTKLTRLSLLRAYILSSSLVILVVAEDDESMDYEAIIQIIDENLNQVPLLVVVNTSYYQSNEFPRTLRTIIETRELTTLLLSDCDNVSTFHDVELQNTFDMIIVELIKSNRTSKVRSSSNGSKG